MTAQVSCSQFGRTADGRVVHAYTLANSSGAAATVLTLGGIVQRLHAPDRAGRVGNIVLGFDTLEPYLDNRAYIGAIIGRYAGRIAGGRFSLDGREYVLSRNESHNTLHGGTTGFDKCVWDAKVDGGRLSLSPTSADGDQGFPGALAVTVTYELSDNNELKISYGASTSAPTVLNLTNHTYWNLSGDGTGDVLDHLLQINADGFTPVDRQLIPVGTVVSVAATSLDFRTPRRLREVLEATGPLTAGAGGIDHNFVLNQAEETGETLAAVLSHPKSGRTLEVLTTEPGLQVYTGNDLQTVMTGRGRKPLPRWGGIALETQHFPDSPNLTAFPSTILRPGEAFRSSTTFRFGLVVDSQNRV